MKKLINYFGKMLCALLLCSGLALTGCTEEPAPVAVSAITLDANSLELQEGDSQSLTATISPSNATNKNVTWSSSNETVASVTDGKVSALKSGETTITVTTEDGDKTAECKVTVKGDPAITSLSEVTATTATFTGHLDVSSSDLSFSQVTVYYSNAETFNLNTANSRSTTSFDDEQNFSISLTSLKYNTKYTYCVVVKVNSEETFGEVKNFTTENVVVEASVEESSITATTALITGIVTGLSDVDKSQIDVGIFYSSESGQVENGQGTKLAASEIPSDNAVSFDLSELSFGTKYYYCSYVKQGEGYVYGEVKDFITKSPDPPTGYTNLSSAGTANCYIISQSGSFCLLVAKGNQSSDLLHLTKSAFVLWESFGTSRAPSVGDLIKSVFYKGGYIAFQTADTFKEGNAVIAAKDAYGNVLWSWHIWFTDQPQAQVYNNDAGIMMDRNLGATSATEGDVGALGLLYQWGRKDPFLGSSRISSSTLAKSTIAWPSAVSSDSSNGTIAYATANPTTFITGNDSNEDWYYTGSSSIDNTRWTTSESSKSIYDPCPSGWRVPDGGHDGIWAKALGSSDYFENTYDDTNEGMDFSGKFGSDQTIWYPASGYRVGFDGVLAAVGYNGFYWPASLDVYYACLFFDPGGYVSTLDYNGRANGLSVRCLQE